MTIIAPTRIPTKAIGKDSNQSDVKIEKENDWLREIEGDGPDESNHRDLLQCVNPLSCR